MKPIDNWKQVLLKAWSAYGLYALVLSGLLNDYCLPLLNAWLTGRGVVIGPGFGTFVSVVATVTLVLRVIQQVALLLPSKPKA